MNEPRISARIETAWRRSLERQLAREERWLAGDWDSRSSRGIATMERHRAKRDELRDALGIPTRCRLGTRTDSRPDLAPCACEASCEPHEHVGNAVLCYHDGRHDHGHCPAHPR